MKIEISKVGDMGEIAIIRVSGMIDSQTVDSFADTVAEVFAQGCHNIILDIDGLTYVNTAGLSVIADAYKKSTQNRGGLKILRAGDVIKELLDVVRFTRIIDIFEDEGEAIGSFR